VVGLVEQILAHWIAAAGLLKRLELGYNRQNQAHGIQVGLSQT
jgi:hypothetical protein